MLASIPAPGNGGDSGMAWAEGSLWVGEYRARKIHQIDPETGVILRTIESNRFVTGVTWVGDELWHATWEGERERARAASTANTGEVLESSGATGRIHVSGLESNGATRSSAAARSGKVRVVSRPRRGSAAGSGS